MAWLYVQGTLLGSSDPNIGAGGLMLVGFAVVILSGLIWGIAAVISRIHE